MAVRTRLSSVVIGFALYIGAPSPSGASLYDFIFRSYPADAEMRAVIAVDCENPNLEGERIEVVELHHHIVARLIDRCEPGRYSAVCTTFILNLKDTTCRAAPALGNYFGRFEGGMRDYVELNDSLPSNRKIPRKYIYGLSWEGAFIQLKGGAAVMFETPTDVRIFLVEE